MVNRIFPGAFTGPQEPPALSRGLPLVGHGVEFVRGTIELLTRAQREHGEVASIHVGPKKMVALFGPAAHEAVFRAPDRQLDVREAYKIMTPVFGEDMVYDAEPSRMNEQLKMLLPALKDRRMRTYAETVVAEVEQSIAAWGDEGEVDLVDYCRVLTNFTSSHCLLGREFRDGMTEKFARVYHDLERGVTPLAYINPYLPIPSFWKRDKARARLVEMIGDIVAQRRRTARRGEDFLQTLMDACYKSGAELTDHEITGMLLAAMFAGHHTSSVTTAWTLIELLQRPDYLAETVAELDRVHGAEPISFTSLRSVPLTDWAVKEALRLHPPLFMLVRTVKETFSFGRYEFAPDTWLLISPTVSHRMADVFIDPHRFDPHRFGPGREEDKRDFAYIPFGGGRHKCMGNAFALLQVKAILAVLLERFEFELVDREVGSDFHGLVVGPTEPCRVRYRRRRRRRAVGSSVVSSTRDEAGPARYRVVADHDLCQGHGGCVGESD
ncbi:MAG: cytochrome P450, partial [Myxococcota bacterium]